MDVSFKDQSLDRLETDATYSAGFGDALVKSYRGPCNTFERLRTSEPYMRDAPSDSKNCSETAKGSIP
jgi:hypothetical protein